MATVAQLYQDAARAAVARVLEDVGSATRRIDRGAAVGRHEAQGRVRAVGEPSVVLLDGPRPAWIPCRGGGWTVLRRAMVGRAVVLTTHPWRRRGLCTRSAIMASGQLRAVGQPFISEAEEWRGLAALEQGARRRRRRRVAARASPRAGRGQSDLRRRGVVQFALADRENMVGSCGPRDDIANGELGAAGRATALEQPARDEHEGRARRREGTRRRTGRRGRRRGEAPLAVPLLGSARRAASDELARCCFGLDRRAHGFLAWVLSTCALVLWLTLSGLLGPMNTTTTTRGRGARPDGYHHPQGQEPARSRRSTRTACPSSSLLRGRDGGCGVLLHSQEGDALLATASVALKRAERNFVFLLGEQARAWKAVVYDDLPLPLPVMATMYVVGTIVR